MGRLRRLLKKVPGVAPAYELWRRKSLERRFKGKPPEEVFQEIFQKNAWRGNESVSGTGSDTDQTRVVVQQLPRLLRELPVRTMLDIPCGDFRWMKDVPLDGIDYLGCDLVGDIVAENRRRYVSKNVTFEQKNLISDPLPAVDLILSRDCMVHLSFKDIRAALRNIVASGSQYLLCTTFPAHQNADIVTGDWRPLNLEAAPFHFPPPLKLIVEECTEVGGAYADKSLGLWRVRDIPGVAPSS